MPSRPVRLRPRDFLKIIAAKFYFLIVFSYDVSFTMRFSVGFALNCRSSDISPHACLFPHFMNSLTWRLGFSRLGYFSVLMWSRIISVGGGNVLPTNFDESIAPPLPTHFQRARLAAGSHQKTHLDVSPTT